MLKRLLDFFNLKRKQVNRFFNAVENSDIETIKRFLAKGYDINQTHQNWDWPAAMSAINDIDTLKCLVEHGADINMQETNKFYSPLINASRLGYTEVVEYLLQNNADTHLISFVSLPALFYALESKHKRIIELLVEAEDNSYFLNEVMKVCIEKNINIVEYKELIITRINSIEEK